VDCTRGDAGNWGIPPNQDKVKPHTATWCSPGGWPSHSGGRTIPAGRNQIQSDNGGSAIAYVFEVIGPRAQPALAVRTALTHRIDDKGCVPTSVVYEFY